MPISRIAYFAQSGTIFNGTKQWTLPISSANIEVTRPIEAVTTFGQFGALNTAQTNITTCKSTLKTYLGSGNGISGISKNFIDEIISGSQTGTLRILVQPNGFQMYGILTNLGLDISLGGFGMCDLGFAGVGNPDISNPISTTISSGGALAIAPVTTMSIGSGGAMSGIYATSLKFSYDLPTDTLGVLGENPNASQLSMQSTIATKAPYKTTMSIEGFGINLSGLLDNAVTGLFQIGELAFNLPKGKVTSRSVSNAAGQVSATFSMSLEDTSATFYTATGSGLYAYGISGVTSYAQNFDQSNLPMYGG